MKCDSRFSVEVCVTGQHREMLDQVLALFGVDPLYDLNIMQPGQTLSGITAAILTGMDSVFRNRRPDFLIVQGDTTTTLAASIAAFYHRVPVVHVEAGLRTGDPNQPFPEEMNRVLTTRLACLHFAPTKRAAETLRAEGVDDKAITISGNTGIDSVLWVKNAIESGEIVRPEWEWLDPTRRLILVTTHRRENFGDEMRAIMKALVMIAQRNDVQIAFPVHRNPEVRKPAYETLAKVPQVVLLDPLSYGSFVDLMDRSFFILTDSGGVQEEAPSLGKPVLVMREKTERPEAVESGTARLVGTAPDVILREANILLDNSVEYGARTRVHNPYGDGRACDVILSTLAQYSASQAHRSGAKND